MKSVATGPRTRRLGAVVIAISVAATLLASCGGSGYRYVESRSNGIYFKVPEEWRVFGKDEVVKATATAATAEGAADPLRYLAVFDADPRPSPQHDVDGTHPFGLARIRALTTDQRDAFSLASLRNELIEVDKIVDADESKVTVVARPQLITQPKGTRGSRIVYTVHADTGSFTVDQTGLVDPATSKVYFFIIGCEASCYDANRRTITEVADSWTIKEP